MKNKIIMLCLILGSWGAFAQHDHAHTADKKAVDSQIMFKDDKL